VRVVSVVNDMSTDPLVAARRRVVRQLVEALTFEGLLTPQPDGDGCWSLPVPAGDAAARYRWRATERFSFGRVSIDGPVCREPGGREALSPRRFLADIAPALGAEAIEPARFAGLADELERTAFNDADAVVAWRERAVPGPDASFDDIETWTVAGHLYHPSYKSRLGFDRDDNHRYGPEFGPTVRPLWLALPRDEVQLTAAPGLDAGAFLRTELGDAFDRFGHAVGGEHVAVPVHPWQWRERLASRLAGPIADGRVSVLGEADDDYRPQQSIRTLANASHPERASLKLALSIVTTSTARTLAPHTLRNGPLVTGWLRGIVRDDPVLRDELRFSLLGEELTASYLGPGPRLPGGPDGELGCLWRESVPSQLEAGDAGERAVPFTTLAQRTSTGRPFVEPWIEAWGVERWTARLLEVAVAPVVRLLQTHGIALEAHAQNLILVHRDGLPERLVARDLHDGIRFSRRHLAEPDRVPELTPTPQAHLRVNRNSFVETDDPEAVRDFVHDAFFFVNLAEVAFVLADHFGLDERRFWAGVRAVVERHRGPLAGDLDLLAPTVGIEPLAGRRLLPDDRLRVRRAPNPLAHVAQVGLARP
jgi:2-[(L-alanin-3-ylcarbamoyl)methyl]-3-(2-aminoethylcarbamoyl)-2-hydroxypropanoate synthase